jgi:hypothetical protein
MWGAGGASVRRHPWSRVACLAGLVLLAGALDCRDETLPAAELTILRTVLLTHTVLAAGFGSSCRSTGRSWPFAAGAGRPDSRRSSACGAYCSIRRSRLDAIWCRVAAGSSGAGQRPTCQMDRCAMLCRSSGFGGISYCPQGAGPLGAAGRRCATGAGACDLLGERGRRDQGQFGVLTMWQPRGASVRGHPWSRVACLAGMYFWRGLWIHDKKNLYQNARWDYIIRNCG